LSASKADFVRCIQSNEKALFVHKYCFVKYLTYYCVNNATFVLWPQDYSEYKSLKMLEKEFKYYLNHQAKLVEKYNGKYLVIKEEEVIGVYSDEQTAFFETSKTLEPGTFMVVFCSPGDEAYTQHFHSRVSFS
jgi:hypothetical protein